MIDLDKYKTFGQIRCNTGVFSGDYSVKLTFRSQYHKIVESLETVSQESFKQSFERLDKALENLGFKIEK